MTPFIDRRRCSSSDGQSALSISKETVFSNFKAYICSSGCYGDDAIVCLTGSEPELRMSSTKVEMTKSSTYATFSTPKKTQSIAMPTTTDLYRTLRLFPESRYCHF